MTNDSNNILGIFNYCDAWCERCGFTARCGNFALGQAMKKGEAAGDIENALFWYEIENGLDDAIEIGEAFEVEEEPWAPDIGQDFEDELRHDQARDHFCVVRAYAYCTSVEEWRKSKESILGECEPGPQTDPAGIHAANAVDIILWYQRFIYVKLRRAVHGALDREKLELDPQGDANGSAKVALIGIDRSLAAWGILLKAFPEQKGRIVPAMANLAGLRRLVEEEFPDARGFIRPGFDAEA